jgi:predicted RNase H-like HicB family nuclease
MKTKQYVVVVEQDEDGVYIAHVPVFPGCHTHGKTLDELNKNLTEVIPLWEKNTKEIPKMTFHSVQVFDLKKAAHA